MPDASFALIYLDPPFNSNAGYNVLFKSASGAGADASIEAFDDTWTWGESSQNALMDIASGTNRPLTVMMNAMHSAIGENPLMAYLAMMAVRLVELHRADVHREMNIFQHRVRLPCLELSACCLQHP